MKRVLVVNDGGDCEEAILGLCLVVEAWNTGFEVADCETEWRGTSPHIKKKKSLFSQQ